MADIKVERSGGLSWPWIVGAIVLLFLVWALFQLYDEPELEPAVAEEVVVPVPEDPPAEAQP